MGNNIQFQRLCQVRNRRRLLSGIGFITAVVVLLSQLSELPNQSYISILLGPNEGMLPNKSELANAQRVHIDEVNNTRYSPLSKEASQDKEGGGRHRGYTFSPQEGLEAGLELTEELKKSEASATRGIVLDVTANSTEEKFRNVAGLLSPGPLTGDLDFAAEASGTSHVAVNTTLVHKKDLEMKPRDRGNDLLQIGGVARQNSSIIAPKSVSKKRKRGRTTISKMNTLLDSTSPSAKLVKPYSLSIRDKELQNARIQIENAPVKKCSLSYSSLFRNYSRFIRSYELMEQVLRVYVYREGEKPIFHQPHPKGVYASEGWFMKLMEKNRQYVVRNSQKAHLFYLPFSLHQLRRHRQQFSTQTDFENHLKNYVDYIARKYRFWNTTRGADHFIVACHDWAPQFTGLIKGSWIRVLCNSNIDTGFQIGKDVSLPVTNIHSAENPTEDLGGNHPSERPILAFFAGSMHGSLRPILLKHWNNKEPDMKIFGPMPRNVEGERRYKEFMKSSRYCICARGYEVHTPRVVESIYNECVPVIISDNYVPPFFEIFNWESFSVFILEKDVPNLRNILLSIPEEKYITMQSRLKIVQKHFVWHKSAVKYDLFHMILHSVWYNRVFQVNYA